MIRAVTFLPPFRRVIAAFAAVLWLCGVLAPGLSATRPAFAGSGDRITTILCTPQGMVKAVLDDNGQIIDSSPADDAQGAGHDCPCVLGCGGMTITAPQGSILLPAPQFRTATTPLSPDSRPLPVPPARGPPLGPRAPPSFLG